MFDPEKFYSKLGKTFKPSILNTVVLAAFDLAKQGKKFISMTGGSYDVPSMPVEEVKEIFAQAPHEAWTEMLQYGSTTGMSSLKQGLSKFMGEAGIDADPNGGIIVTTGSQEAIDLVTRVFIDPGDIIYVGKPTYLQALSAFRTVNPVFREVSRSHPGPRSIGEHRIHRLQPCRTRSLRRAARSDGGLSERCAGLQRKVQGRFGEAL